jgi:hypothetical protein
MDTPHSLHVSVTVLAPSVSATGVLISIRIAFWHLWQIMRDAIGVKAESGSPGRSCISQLRFFLSTACPVSAADRELMLRVFDVAPY